MDDEVHTECLEPFDRAEEVVHRVVGATHRDLAASDAPARFGDPVPDAQPFTDREALFEAPDRAVDLAQTLLEPSETGEVHSQFALAAHLALDRNRLGDAGDALVELSQAGPRFGQVGQVQDRECLRVVGSGDREPLLVQGNGGLVLLAPRRDEAEIAEDVRDVHAAPRAAERFQRFTEVPVRGVVLPRSECDPPEVRQRLRRPAVRPLCSRLVERYVVLPPRNREVAAPRGEVPERDARFDLAVALGRRRERVDRVLEEPSGRVDVDDRRRERTGREQRPGAGFVRCAARCERSVRPRPPFCRPAAELPEPSGGADDPASEIAVLGSQRPLQRREDVVLVGPHRVECGRLVRMTCRGRSRGGRSVGLCVQAGRARSIVLIEATLRVRPDDLEEREPFGVVRRFEEPARREGPDPSRVAEDSRRSVHRDVTREDTQRFERRPVVVVEQVDAPADAVLHRPLAVLVAPGTVRRRAEAIGQSTHDLRQR